MRGVCPFYSLVAQFRRRKADWLFVSNLLTIAETPRGRFLDQLKISVPGTFAGCLIGPLTLQEWAPTSFVVWWAIVFAVQSLAFLGLVSWTGNRWIWSLWESTAGLLFGAIAVSVLVWGGGNPAAPWIAGGLLLAYISFELASVPYLPVPIWFGGSLLAAIPLLVMLFVTLGPVVAVGVSLAVMAMTFLAFENRDLRDGLTDSLKRTNEELLTDPLTGLCNRRGLQQELLELRGQVVTLAVFDADRFKHINDTQGHGVGDQALIALSNHLREELTDGWTVSRYGGDEFVAVAAGTHDLEATTADPVAVELIERDGSLNVSLSVGVASGILDDNGDRLKSEAGHALRHAKRAGTKIVRSEGAIRDRFERSLAITATDRTQLPVVPVVQPIVVDEGVVGAEILARWQLDDGTLLEPAMFMDMLIENGFLGQLDDDMLEHAVMLAARLESKGYDLVVSANIAASHLLDSEVPERVARLLKLHNVEPMNLMLEVTESVRLSEQRVWESSVFDLRDLGIRLAIDDFGAGYSSVARLSHLPFTDLKLDRTLVEGAAGPLGEIVKGVTRFCAESDITVIAEGVETMEELEAVRALGVTTLQGYLIGRPMRIEDFLRDLDARTESTGDVALVQPDALPH